MNESRRELGHRIVEFLENHGLDPMYTLTVIAVLVALSYSKQIKHWEELEDWRKGLVASAVFAAVVFSLISLLRLVGILDFGL